MNSIRLFILLLGVCLSAFGLEVRDIFSEDVIKQASFRVTHENFGLNIHQFLKKYNYPIESHEVTTEDGYILTMHRIPTGRNEVEKNTQSTKPAVLLMHGLFSSSMDWVNMGPNVSLGLLLADAGYDVWLGNSRGNTWSRRHVSLDPNQNKSFWDFSFEDCGYYDLPAMVDHILAITGLEKVTYVGHSQGTTQFFAFASLRPEYNEKITLMTALAPASYMKNMAQPLVQLASNYTTLIKLVLDQLEIYELLPNSPFLTEILKIICGDGSDYQEFCAQVLFFIVGTDSPQLDRSFIEVIITNAPAGASVKMVLHYLQEVNSGFFRRYDYGLENLIKYKQLSPPQYDTSLIKAPVALYYSKNDLFVAISDLEQFADELPNVVEKKLVEYEAFNHLDFIWAIDVKTLLYDDVIEVINKYNFV